LYIAAENGDTETVLALLDYLPTLEDKKALLQTADDCRWTALESASSNMLKTVIKHLGGEALILLEVPDLSLDTTIDGDLFKEGVTPWVKAHYQNPVEGVLLALLQQYKDIVCKALLAEADKNPDKMLPVLRSISTEGQLLHAVFGTSASKGPHKWLEGMRSAITRQEPRPWNYRLIVNKAQEIERKQQLQVTKCVKHQL